MGHGRKTPEIPKHEIINRREKVSVYIIRVPQLTKKRTDTAKDTARDRELPVNTYSRF